MVKGEVVLAGGETGFYPKVDQARVRESQVINIWRHQLVDGAEMVTEGGEPIRVVYPGRINDDRGADFRDVAIATDRGLMKGEVEVHVKASDWRAHRHHQDPAYNQVILHVVMWRDTEAVTGLQNGEQVPILALGRYMKGRVSSSMPCLRAVGSLSPDVMAEVIDAAGKKRLLGKANKFQVELAKMEAGQSLYRGVMGALGYAKNKMPCLELACRLPLHLLESIAREKISDQECLARQQGLLLGTAGLLPSQRCYRHQGRLGDEWVAKLEQLWACYCHTEAMPESKWHLFKVRPNNFPVRRIVAMSYLILRYRERGIFDEIVNMVREAPIRGGHHRLEGGLMVRGSDYWASHFDFGLGSRLMSPTLLGNRRADDIIVNVLLPFTYAWGRLTSQPELEKKAIDLYYSYPRLLENAVERHMKYQLGLSSSLVNSAQRQQGLIHIYNTLCTQGRCSYCPLSQLSLAHIQASLRMSAETNHPS